MGVRFNRIFNKMPIKIAALAYMCRLFITQLLQNRLVLSAFQSDHAVYLCGPVYVCHRLLRYASSERQNRSTKWRRHVNHNHAVVGRSVGACECVEWPAWENDDRVDEVVGSNYISDPHRL